MNVPFDRRHNQIEYSWFYIQWIFHCTPIPPFNTHQIPMLPLLDPDYIQSFFIAPHWNGHKKQLPQFWWTSQVAKRENALIPLTKSFLGQFAWSPHRGGSWLSWELVYVSSYIIIWQHVIIYQYVYICIVYTDIQIYRYTDIQIYRHTYIHTYIHTYTHTHIHRYIHTYITWHYIRWHYIRWHYITFQYFTLHYINYIRTLH